MNMNDLQALAISKATIKADRPEVGLHEVDFHVHVKGTVNIADDTSRTPTVSIPMKEVLALFIQRAGITRKHSVELLRSAMEEALKKGPAGKGAIDAASDIEQISKDIVTDVVASLPKTPVKGRVTTKLDVNLVD